MTVMITIISTLATRVAFHANPGRMASMFVLTGRSFRDANRYRAYGESPDERGSLQHLVGVMFITRMLAARGRGTEHYNRHMSDHAERLRKLRHRILAAKEFL
jgi:hypothetical protein